MTQKLDKEEQVLLASFENNEWQSVSNLKSEKKRFQVMAKQPFNKTKSVELRLTEWYFSVTRY